MTNETTSNFHHSQSVGAVKAGAAREKRNRMFKAGIASYQNNSITVDCVIRDLTSSGAKLKFEKGSFVPGLFMLTIPVDGIKVDCEVKWRHELEVGVAFVSDIQKDIRNIRKQSVDVKYVVPKKSVLRKSNN